MANRDERNEYATAKWDAEEVRRQAASEQHRRSSGGSRRRQAKRNRTIAYFACVLLVSCLLAGIGWLLVNDVCSLNKAPVEVEITVEEGDSRGDVAKKLHDAGLVNSRLVFNIAGTFLHYDRYVEPGTYKLNSDMDFRALITNMHDWEADSKAAQGLVKVTIPEGYTVQETIELLASKGVGTVEELTDACANYPFEDYTFLDSSKLGDISRMEGFLYPDTHEFYTGKAVLAIDTLLYAFQMQISEQMQADIQKSGYSLSEIITMASMIEKESINDDAERKNIASVLYNRMNNSSGETAGFLQVDATIDYALKLQGKDHSSFTTSLDSPYNTYLHKGLPAGPICSPSLSSIKAAIYPNQTDYYFYALGKDGVHHFFKTYAEHLNFINSSDYQSIG